MADAPRLLDYQTPVPALRPSVSDYVRAFRSAVAVCFAIVVVGTILGLGVAPTSNPNPDALVIVLIPAIGLAAVQFRYSLRCAREAREKRAARPVIEPLDNLDILWQSGAIELTDHDPADGRPAKLS